jgi:hypothetical protein
MDVLSGVRLVGPLVPFAQGFADELTRLGFTPLSARDQLRLVMCLSRWLAEAPAATGAPCKDSPTSSSCSPTWTLPANGDSTNSTPSANSSPPGAWLPPALTPAE